MSLYISGTRQRGSEFFTDMPARHVASLEYTLVQVIKYELGFGGHITALSETSCTIQTAVFFCLDTTTVEADSPEEFKPVLEALQVFVGVDQMLSISEKTDIWTKAAPDNMVGLPFAVAHIAPMIIGDRMGRLGLQSLVLAHCFERMGVTTENGVADACQENPALIEKIKSLDLENLCGVYASLISIPDMSVVEIVLCYDVKIPER